METQSAVTTARVAHDVERCENPTKCANCGHVHKTNSKECPVWNKEREILRIKYTNEARKMVEQQTVNIAQSHSSIAKSNNQSVIFVNAETQTKSVTTLAPGGDTKTKTLYTSENISNLRPSTPSSAATQA